MTNKIMWLTYTMCIVYLSTVGDLSFFQPCVFSSEDNCGFVDNTTSSQHRWHRVYEYTNETGRLKFLL